MPAPDFARGFFKVPRDVYVELLESGERDALLVYLELVSRAAYREGKRVGGTGVIELKVGQCLVGRGDLAARTSTTEAKVRRSLALLQDRQLIAMDTNKRGTTVTVLGLESQPTDRQQNSHQTANRTANQERDVTARTIGEISTERSPKSPTEQPPNSQQNSRETATNRDQRSEIREAQNPPPRAHAIPEYGVHTYPAELLPLSEEIWRGLEALRVEVAAARGEEIRPLGVFDRGKTDLRMRLRESAGPDLDVDRARADAKHVLAVRRAEAVFKTGTRWLSGSMFTEDSWRQAMAASPQSYERRPPASSTTTPGLRIVRPADADDMPPIRPALRKP